MRNITKDDFINEIFDYTTGGDWKYKGTAPMVVDFYADWCGPCRMISPILEELQTEFPEVVFVKVDVDSETELPSQFGVSSIPSLLFIPLTGEPIMSNGVVPKPKLKQQIIDTFNI
jgi:thioredoxin 1